MVTMTVAAFIPVMVTGIETMLLATSKVTINPNSKVKSASTVVMPVCFAIYLK